VAVVEVATKVAWLLWRVLCCLSSLYIVPSDGTGAVGVEWLMVGSGCC
jgi:hypothetical protein